ncbi:BTB/POZ protein [Rhizophagus clarus]|uniref:BTB/POZ protein n=1 Tax=Rhizophagus clarus TaxID=94130 RepID=A0A8H3QET5_9GLOM|nr:BTB/POZ protein [Rhizophagus clarus]
MHIYGAADELLLQEVVDYLQKYLIEHKSEWMEQHFELIHQAIFRSNSLLLLQQFCTDFIVKSPEKIFKSLDFTSLPEKGSRDGYTPKVFHELCDETSHTVTFIKIKGKDEIIGGYNPLIWKSSAGFNRYKKTKESFIFSFKNNNAKDGIIINIEDTDRALWYNPSAGPFFVQDIIVYADNSLNYDDVRNFLVE